MIGAAIDERQPWSARDLRGLTRCVVVPVDPRRPSRLRHQRQDVAAADNRTSPHGHPARRCAPASDRRRRAVTVIPADDRDVRVEQRADLHRNGIEHLAGWCIASDERRHAAQRGLLVGQPEAASRDSAFAIAVATSSVNAASRVSASSAQGSPRSGPRHQRAPEPPADEDRHSHRRLQLQVAGKRANLDVCIVALSPRRRPGRDDSAGDRVWLERVVSPDRHGRPFVAPDADQRRRAVAGEDLQGGDVSLSSCPTCSQTAVKIRSGGTSSATSVATRRSAACSSASRARASRKPRVDDRRRDQLREVVQPAFRIGGSETDSMRRRSPPTPRPRRRSGSRPPSAARSRGRPRACRAAGRVVCAQTRARVVSYERAPTAKFGSSG